MSIGLHAIVALAAPGGTLPPPPLGGGEMLRVVLSLVAVVVLILVVGWLTRRMQTRVRAGGQRLRCVETMVVGTKEKVLLLQVGERQLLVGASPNGLRTLLVLDEALPPAPPTPMGPRGMGESFRTVLAQWRKKSP